MLSLKLAVEHLLWKYFYKSGRKSELLHSRLEAASNGQGSKALQEYEKCIKRGVEPGGPQLPCRKQIFDLQRKGIELRKRKSILEKEGAELSEKKVLQLLHFVNKLLINLAI